MLLRSKDVLHDFTVPQFRVKMDLVPGMITYLWLTPTKVGAYEILCEEMCGMGHFVMRGRVVVDDADAYEQWLASAADIRTDHGAARRRRRRGPSARSPCAPRVTAPTAEGNQALNAPKLAGQPGWYLERQLRNFKHGHSRRSSGRCDCQPDGRDGRAAR